jgi:hypothetical protein
MLGLASFGISLGVSAADCRYEYSLLKSRLEDAGKIPTYCVEPFEDALERMNGTATMLRDEPQMTLQSDIPIIEQLIDDVKACPAEWQRDALAGFTANVEDNRKRTQEKGCHDPAVFAEMDATIARLTQSVADSREQSRQIVAEWRKLERAVREGHERWERAVNERQFGDLVRGEGPMDDILRDNAEFQAGINRMVEQSQAIAEANRSAQAALERAAAAPVVPPPSAAPPAVIPQSAATTAPKPATPAPPKPTASQPVVAGVVSPTSRPATPATNPKAYLTTKPITEITAVTDMWYQDREFALNLTHTKLLNMSSAYCDHNTRHTEVVVRDRKCDQMESFGTTQYKCTIRAAVQCRATPCDKPYCGADPKQQ